MIPVILRGDTARGITLSPAPGYDYGGCTLEVEFNGARRTFDGLAAGEGVTLDLTADETARMPTGTGRVYMRLRNAAGEVLSLPWAKVKVTDAPCEVRAAQIAIDPATLDVEDATAGDSLGAVKSKLNAVLAFLRGAAGCALLAAMPCMGAEVAPLYTTPNDMPGDAPLMTNAAEYVEAKVSAATNGLATAADLGGYLKLTGGTLTGDLEVGEMNAASRKLTIAADNGATGITMTGGTSTGNGSIVAIGGSRNRGGTLIVNMGLNYGGRINVLGGLENGRGGSISVTGNGASISAKGTNASIKKGDDEVATEKYVNTQVSGVESTLTTLAGAVNAKADASSVYTKIEIDEQVIAASNQTFSNAVLAVGLNIDTNSVAVLNEIAETFGGFPIEGTATTVGGLLAALAAAIAWLKKNKADKATTLAGYGITDAATMASLAPEYSPSSSYSVGAFVYHDGNIYQCTTAIADGGEAWNAAHWELRKLDDFFTNSNSLLTGTIDAEVISKGTAPDAHLEAPTDEHLKLILADNSVAYDSAKALPYKLTSVIGDRVIATMTLTAASTDITLPTITANDTTVKDFILDVTNAYAVEGVATDAGINIPRTDFKLVTRDGESLTDVTTVKAGKSAFICFTQKSPVVVDGTTYPCWCVIQLPFGDPS